MKAEIVSIGRELLMGDTADTNATYLARQLPLLGIDLVWVSQVGDNQAQMVEVLKRGWQRSDLVITTGGLGPTGDDLTREAIAEMMDEQMSIDPHLEHDLRERFQHYGMRDMPVSNLKQCTLIASAAAIPNPQGTAPGWWVEKDGRVLVCMPGPPREMYEMWEKQVRPRLQKRSKSVIQAKTWKTFGLSEGAVGELAFPLFPTDNPSLGVYAKPDGIHLQLKVTASTEAEAREMMATGEKKIRGVLDRYIWGTDDETLESAIGRLLVEKGLTLAVMEDYSGGLLTAGLSEVAGSGTFFKGGLVVPTDEAKMSSGVDQSVIEQHGGASAEAAAAMAEAIRRQFSASLGIGITGISDQTGSVYLAIVNGRSDQAINHPRNKQRLTTAALFELRKALLDGKGNA